MAAEQPAMRPSDLPVDDVLGRASGPRRPEADELVSLFSEVSGEPPRVWAGRIVGFGEFEYRHDSGRRGRSPRLAFAPGPRHHTIYLPEDFSERWPDLMARLGTYRASKVCLYVTRLADVDPSTLRALLERSLAESRPQGATAEESA